MLECLEDSEAVDCVVLVWLRFLTPPETETLNPDREDKRDALEAVRPSGDGDASSSSACLLDAAPAGFDLQLALLLLRTAKFLGIIVTLPILKRV